LTTTIVYDEHMGMLDDLEAKRPAQAQALIVEHSRTC